jgi:hypothetical protein
MLKMTGQDFGGKLLALVLDNLSIRPTVDTVAAALAAALVRGDSFVSRTTPNHLIEIVGQAVRHNEGLLLVLPLATTRTLKTKKDYYT